LERVNIEMFIEAETSRKTGFVTFPSENKALCKYQPRETRGWGKGQNTGLKCISKIVGKVYE